MKKLTFFLLFLPIVSIFSQINGEDAIKKEIHENMIKSAEYWNKGDVDAYMNICYPNREDILMQSANSRIYGYKKIYDMYAKLFPNAEARGVLTFSDVEVTVFNSDTAMEIGKFTLTFSNGKTRSGYFTAIHKKFPQGWRIVHDHS